MINRLIRVFYNSTIKIEPISIEYNEGLFDTKYGLLKMTRNYNLK